MNRSRFLLGPVAAIWLIACNEGPSDSGDGAWEAIVDTVADTVTVRTLSGSIWGDTATLEQEVSIGALEGPDEYVFAAPSAIAVGSDGTIYVLDTQVPVLRSYGPDGVYRGDLGRDGSGPGEYQGPDGLAVLPDGRVLVRDPPNSRITVYGADGSWLEQWPHSGGFNTDRRHYVDTAGNNYASTLLERGKPPWEWEFGLVRRSSTGELLDTVPAPTWEYDRAEVTASREGSSSVRTVPFTGKEVWTFSPLGYMVGGLSSDYRIDLYRVDAPVLRIERDWTPVRVLSEEAEEQRRRITEGLQRQYGRWRWNGPEMPTTKPPFKQLFVSEEGDIWVALSSQGRPRMSEAEAIAEREVSGRTPLRFWEPPRLDVFSSRGEYLGPVRTPETLRFEPEPIVRGDYMWALTRDELDVPSVVRFRIVRPE
jgi:hypothetical protein